VLFGVGAGVLAGIGQILNYETFRRIDGFIAFLMFNVSILITFIIEVFFLGQFKPSWILLAGGGIIIASTILAELINSHCEKKGL
jgi:drug/metabolite transporter (DMT)-like permease